MNMTRSLSGLIPGLIFFLACPMNAASQPAKDNFQATAGEQAFQKGDYSEAERYYRDAWKNATTTNGPASRRAAVLGNLAQVLANQNRLKEAEVLFDRAVEIAKHEPVDLRVRIALLVNISALYTRTHRLERAESLLDEAFILCRKHLVLTISIWRWSLRISESSMR